MGIPERQKENKGPFLREGSNITLLTPGVLKRIKSHALVSTKGEQAVCPLQPSLEAERQMHNSQRLKARGHCKLSHRVETPCQAVSRLPVTNYISLGSWMVYIGQECHSLRQASLRRHMAHPGLHSGAPVSLSSLDLGPAHFLGL